MLGQEAGRIIGMEVLPASAVYWFRRKNHVIDYPGPAARLVSCVAHQRSS
jgi:hypothetical protein